MLTKKQTEHIFNLFEKHDPLPKIELNYSSPFELLIAVILSAQATDKSVNIATRELFQKANTPEKIFHLGESNLKTYIKKIGLYNAKAKNIINLCKILIEKHSSNVPSTREELENLPGVGRKSANIILNIIFNQPTIAVDTHVFRVANRTGLSNETTPLKVEKQLIKAIPKQYKKRAHYWLVLHGRYICKAKKPNCCLCIINKLCQFKNK